MKTTPEILSECIHELYMNGFTTASGGNISQKDEAGNVWISPSQIDKGFLKPTQFALLKNGEWVGDYSPSMEYPFHLAIYENYPEAKAVCHLHSPVLVALSCLNNPFDYINLSGLNISVASYAIPGNEKLVEFIISAFKDVPSIVLMKNHGAISYGQTINEAAEKIVKLEKKVSSLLGIYFLNSLGENFDLKNDNSILYYNKRSKYFLHIKDKFFKMEKLESGEKYYSIFKLSSYCEAIRNRYEINLALIPESYLILRNYIKIDESPDESKIKSYLDDWNLDSPIMMFNEGTIVAIGNSLFNLYDKMEVLFFTLKVFLLAKKMGKLDALTHDQILELKNQFL